MFAYSDFASSVTRRLGSGISFTFLNSRENLLCLWCIRVFPQLYVKCGNRHILKYLRYDGSLSLLLSHQGYLLFVFLVVSKISVFLGHFFSGTQRLFHLFCFLSLFTNFMSDSVGSSMYSVYSSTFSFSESALNFLYFLDKIKAKKQTRSATRCNNLDELHYLTFILKNPV